MTALLPPNTSTFERSADASSAARCAAMPITGGTLWSAATCPAPLLSTLAWALAVDIWDASWPDTRKREAIGQAVAVHQAMGTVAALRRALDAAGYATARIYDTATAPRYDATHTFNGALEYVDGVPHWHDYGLYMDRPVSLAQAAHIRRILRVVAPMRARLAFIKYAIGNLYNGALRYDETYTYGVA